MSYLDFNETLNKVVDMKLEKVKIVCSSITFSSSHNNRFTNNLLLIRKRDTLMIKGENGPIVKIKNAEIEVID